jgi:serine/threonine-protein kinase
MIVTPDSQVHIIDWNRDDWGDSWEEFNRIVWDAQCSPSFASGRVDSYFGGNVPELFWQLLAFYIGSNTLASIYWAIPFGQGNIDTMMRQSQDVMSWYDNFKRIVPTWYRKQSEVTK